MGRLVGIDLGTTNSVVAAMQGPRPQILHNLEGQSQTRSIVGLRKRRDRSEMLVGEAALANWGQAVEDTVVSVKRLMGRGVADPEVQRVRQWAQYRIVEPSTGTKEGVRVVLGGVEYSPIGISALILKKLKDDAEYRLGEEVTHAVITVPAYFSHIQKEATRRAGAEAGLRVIKILDEPTAAAIAYGMDDAEPRTILVYDLGGGTFDISVLVMSGGIFAPLNLEGDMWLGGDNFDQVLIERAVQHVHQEFGIDPRQNGRFMVELKKAARGVKETLSSARSADLIVSGALDDGGRLIDVDFEVTREEFEALIQPLVDRTMSLVQRALVNAGLTAADVDFVLMAGNATTTPLVQRSMEELFGPAKVLRKIHPKESVALGAAIVAAIIGPQRMCGAPDPADRSRECGEINNDEASVCKRCGVPLTSAEGPTDQARAAGDAIEGPAIKKIVDIAPFHYGVPTNGTFTVFVRKNDPYPTKDPQSHVFGTRMPNARMISIPVFGGDNLEDARANERQGEAFAILPQGLPKGTPIRISLWLDSDGSFKLTARLDDGTGTDLKPWVVEKGEAHDRAIATLERVDEVLALKGQLAKQGQLDAVEKARERVFQELKGGKDRYREAVAEVERLERMVIGLGEELPVERLLDFASGVTQTFRWAFDPAKADRLDDLAEKTRAAIESGDDEVIETRFRQLDHETDELPQPVMVLLAIFQVIMSRIEPYDPAAASRLTGELRAVGDTWRTSGRDAAEPPLRQLVAHIEQVLATVPPPPGGNRCPNGHVFPGGRYCPIDGIDTWQLEKRAG